MTKTNTIIGSSEDIHTIQNIYLCSLEYPVIYITIRSDKMDAITVLSRPKMNVRFSFVIGTLIFSFLLDAKEFIRIVQMPLFSRGQYIQQGLILTPDHFFFASLNY